MKKELKITADGSHTLFIANLGETYHSIHGAIQEAKHVFIQAGFKNISKQKINCLEIGFGTGLNAFLTVLEAKEDKKVVNYTAIEAFPLELELIERLNYTTKLKLKEEEAELFDKLHQVEWEAMEEINNHFQLKKIEVAINDFDASEKFDVIYFDAFGPRVQAEMWTEEVFLKMSNCLNGGGVLATYCAKGSVKRTLKTIGFNVETLPGPPGKREMTLAHKL